MTNVDCIYLSWYTEAQQAALFWIKELCSPRLVEIFHSLEFL